MSLLLELENITDDTKSNVILFVKHNYRMLYAFFWVIPDFVCRRFGTLCLFHLHRQVVV